MQLIGRYQSPFVRRVAIWLNFQGRPFEHVALQPRGPDLKELEKANPLGRVPALKLDDGTVLIETFAIIDYLEETAPAGKTLLPASGPERIKRQQGVALSHSLAEKAIAMTSEKSRRPPELHWGEAIARLEAQMTIALDLLEAHTAETGYGSASGKPDGAVIAAVCAFDFIAKHFSHLTSGRYPRLVALSARANALPEFASTVT